MAVVHKFRRNVTDLNLNAGAGAGWRTVAWNPKVATPAYGEVPEPVEETLTLLADCSSQDDLATKLQALDAMRVGANRYMRDRLEQYPVWWHAKAYSETGERRALVRKIETEIMCPLVTRADWVEDSRAVARARVTREGVWERTAARDMPTATPAAGASVVYDYTGSAIGVSAHDIVGDLPARVGLFQIRPSVGDHLGRVWIGLRSANQRGTLANFINIWEYEDSDATLGTDAARDTDASASPGGGGDTKVVVTPGTATWAKRHTIRLEDVTANPGDNFGQFLWLLRTKVSSGTWEVQLRFGYILMDDADFCEGPVKEVSSSSWDYIEMGVQDIPIRDFHAIDLAWRNVGSEGSFVIQTWARRTSGSGTLDLDCLCPIPLDEGWLASWNFGDLTYNGDWGAWCFGTSPTGVTQCMAYGEISGVSGWQSMAPFAADNFYLPVGDGRMIIVNARTSSANIGDNIYISTSNQGKYLERWLQLRGSE